MRKMSTIKINIFQDLYQGYFSNIHFFFMTYRFLYFTDIDLFVKKK